MDKDKIYLEGATTYGICPHCNKVIPFQGVDIQYYEPIGADLENTPYTDQQQVIDTGKTIACPYCKKISKAKDFKFVINDF